MDRTTRLWLPVTVLGCLLALNACGGGGSDTASQPAPKTHLADELPDFNKAIADQDCDGFARLNYSLLRQTTTPGAAPTGNECSRFKPALASLQGVKYTDAAEYGTGAIASGGSGQRTNNGIFILDRDGVYRFLLNFEGDKQVGSSPVSTESPDANAQTFVDAIKAGDCEKADPVISTQSPALQQFGGDVDKFCEAFAHGKILAPALKATDDPKVTRMGATLDLAFYGVPTESGWFTMILGSDSKVGQKQAPPDKVLDVLANTDVPGIPATQK